jgi:hypothetical protein
MNRTLKLFVSCLALGAALVPSIARADGLLVKTSALPESARRTLAAEIAAAKKKDPTHFDMLAKAKLNGIDPAVYGQARNPIPGVGRELRALKGDGLLPLIDALAFTTPARGSHTDAEWRALQLGVLEALGTLRDAKAGPVLRAAFEAQPSGDVARAAAEAVGMLCGDDDVKLLTKRATKGDALFNEAVRGLGQCRRPEAAKHLASLLDKAADGTAASSLVAALDDLGSSWAWQAKVRGASPSDQAAITKAWNDSRSAIGPALAKAFARFGGDTRKVTERAIRKLEHPTMGMLLQGVRATTDATGQAAIDALVLRLQK